MNTQIITTTNLDGTTTDHVIIDWGNNQFTSMLKADYEAQQAVQANPAQYGVR